MYQEPKASNQDNFLDTSLIQQQYHQYKQTPHRYLLTLITQHKIWSSSPSTIEQFLLSINSLYRKIPYHNLTHAFDVTINLDQYLIVYGFQQKMNLSNSDRIYMLLAAYAHDCGHEGLTNEFYKNTNHDLAIQYYMHSPLENMHAANLINQIVSYGIDVPQQKRRLMVEMILKTDNCYHQWAIQSLSQFNELSKQQWSTDNKINQMGGILLHAADLSNSTKDIQLCLKWANNLYEQFNKQIDKELSLGLIPSLRKITSPCELANSNISFFDHLVIPLFKKISVINHSFEIVHQKAVSNRNYWMGKAQQQINE